MITSLGKDKAARNFIASVEGRKMPFFGFQFHPERAEYDLRLKENSVHTEDLKRIVEKMAKFFVGKANSSKRNTKRSLAKKNLLNKLPKIYYEYDNNKEVYIFSK